MPEPGCAHLHVPQTFTFNMRPKSRVVVGTVRVWSISRQPFLWLASWANVYRAFPTIASDSMPQARTSVTAWGNLWRQKRILISPEPVRHLNMCVVSQNSTYIQYIFKYKIHTHTHTHTHTTISNYVIRDSEPAIHNHKPCHRAELLE